MEITSIVLKKILTLEMAEDNTDLIPESDRDFLNEKGYIFKIIPQGGQVHLILEQVPFSELYAPRVADILIMIPVGYPNAQLDMFWTFPEIRLVDGNLPQATEHRQDFHGRTWQRWSRHPSVWRAGVDNLRTFISMIKKEIEKGNG